MTSRLPTTDRGVRTAEAILDHAADEFARRGYHATSVAGICRRGGLANASFYQYFTDKRQIHGALVERARAAMEDALAQATDLESLCAVVFDFLAEHSRVLQVSREAEFLDLDPGIGGREFYQPVTARIQVLLDVDEATAWAVVGAQFFVALRFGTWDGRAIPQPVQETFLDLASGGISAGSIDSWNDLTLPGVLPVASAAAEATGDGSTRDALIAAARELFGSQGYAATKITDITARVDVAQGTFYAHFPSKRAVLARVVDDIRLDLMGRTAAAGRTAGDRIERERRNLLIFLDWLRTNRDAYRIVREAEFVGPEIGRGYYQAIADTYGLGLRAALERGELRPLGKEDVAIETIAWALMGISHFAGLRWVLWDPAAGTPPGAIASTLRFLMRGLAAA